MNTPPPIQNYSTVQLLTDSTPDCEVICILFTIKITYPPVHVDALLLWL